MEDGMDPELMATACLKYMPDAMIEHMLFTNEFIGFDEDKDE